LRYAVSKLKVTKELRQRVSPELVLIGKEDAADRSFDEELSQSRKDLGVGIFIG
jgi:hypothetical protein